MLAGQGTKNMSNNTVGAFGGAFNHQVIKELRAELAKSRLMLSALCEHTKIGEKELLAVVSEYIAKQQELMRKV